MKNFILSAAMILIVLFAFSFSGSNVMVTKPVTPKQTAVITIDTYGTDIDRGKAEILRYAKTGWIVSHTISNGQSDRVIVVLVKY